MERPSPIRTTFRARWKARGRDRASRRNCCAGERPLRSASRWVSGRGGADMRTFGEVAERLRRSTVQVFSDQRRSGGSGVIWSADGVIVTNAHVTRSARNDVELWDGRRLEARVDAYDARLDLALLRVPATGLPAATAGDSTALRPGELAIAIGSPLGF